MYIYIYIYIYIFLLPIKLQGKTPRGSRHPPVHLFFWSYLGTILGPSWHHFGTGPSWDHLGTCFSQSWENVLIIFSIIYEFLLLLSSCTCDGNAIGCAHGGSLLAPHAIRASQNACHMCRMCHMCRPCQMWHMRFHAGMLICVCVCH